MPEPGPSAGIVEPRMHPDRPVDPRTAELRAEPNPVRRLFKVLGPGMITGASDDDPSGIGTYAQAGAQHGFATLWTTVVMLPMMIAVQYMCAKIGLATGRGPGLEHKLTRAPQFYAVIVAATLVGMVIAILDVNPIAALVLSAVINGLIAAPLLVLVMLISNNRAAMGDRTNGRMLNVVGWVTTGVMGAAAVGLIVTTILG